MNDIEKICKKICGHIKDPYTLGEVVMIIESDHYGAEMMMQHLLLIIRQLQREKEELEKHQARWVSVKERLPKGGHHYYCVSGNDLQESWTDEMWLPENGRFAPHVLYWLDNVPHPPQEGGQP